MEQVMEDKLRSMTKLKTVANFIYYNGGNYHKFCLPHYISLRSFLVTNPEWSLILHTNVEMTSGWWIMLLQEFSSRIRTKYIDASDLDKYDCISHFVDHYKLKWVTKNGGLVLDSDYLFLAPMSQVIDPDRFNIEEELGEYGKFCQIILSMMYSNGMHDAFLDEWLRYYDNYEKGKPWTYYAGTIPTKLWKESHPDAVHVISADITDPYSANKQDLERLFMHDEAIDPSKYLTVHFSESAAWKRYLEFLDIEHIMTVNTTFNRLARRFVEHLWDSDKKESKVKFEYINRF